MHKWNIFISPEDNNFSNTILEPLGEREIAQNDPQFKEKFHFARDRTKTLEETLYWDCHDIDKNPSKSNDSFITKKEVKL